MAALSTLTRAARLRGNISDPTSNTVLRVGPVTAKTSRKAKPQSHGTPQTSSRE